MAIKSQAENASPASEGKAPAHATRRKDAAPDPRCGAGRVRAEGVFERSIVGITQRAKVALGTFTPTSTARRRCSRRWSRTCRHGCATMSPRRWKARLTRSIPKPALWPPTCASSRSHKEVYRIIDEAEFVDPAGFETHYETTA